MCQWAFRNHRDSWTTTDRHEAVLCHFLVERRSRRETSKSDLPSLAWGCLRTFRCRAPSYGSKTRRSVRIRLTNVFSMAWETSALTPKDCFLLSDKWMNNRISHLELECRITEYFSRQYRYGILRDQLWFSASVSSEDLNRSSRCLLHPVWIARTVLFRHFARRGGNRSA